MFKALKNKAFSTSSASLPAPASAANHEAVLLQVHDFETALRAMDLLLDDRNKEGTELLTTESKSHATRFDDPAAIFPLALGVMEFIEATMGFETEVMVRAHKTLSAAEAASVAHAKYNTKRNLATSHIYPPGTEFQVTLAESTLLNALVMLLQENNSMMEQAKALLKLRKAYQILDATYKKIQDSEPLFARNLARFQKLAMSQNVTSTDLPGFTVDSSASLPEDQRLMRNLEKVYQLRRARIEGTSIRGSDLEVNMFSAASSISSKNPSKTSRLSSGVSSRAPSRAPSVAPAKTRSNLTKSDKPNKKGDEKKDAFDVSSAVSGQGSYAASEDFSDAVDFSDSVEVFDLNADQSSNVESAFSTSGSMVSTAEQLHVSTIDEFIHSGVQLCFGILQVVLSLIPPTIGRVLSIVGFKGDRKLGLQMLWRTAITARNIHGALALIFLLVFYDGPLPFVDTAFRLPELDDSQVKHVLTITDRSTVTADELDKVLANPALYTPQLLSKARELFPHNGLWLLQEGRILAAQGKIHEALTLMQDFTDDDKCHIEMEQVEALLVFDRAIFYTFVQDYDSAARDFTRMVSINSWSPAVYLFAAGACYLEKWRLLQSEGSDEKEIAWYAEKANHYLKLAPTYIPDYGANASKKGGIGGSGKQMPFDKFVLRKTKRIEAVQKANKNLQYIECVGTSLILELCYFWNYYIRTPQRTVENSLRMLDFSVGPHAKIGETGDEAMIRNFLKSCCLKALGRHSEGVEVLDSEVLARYVAPESEGPFKFTKMTYSPYLYPMALYERACLEWGMSVHKAPAEAVKKAAQWIKKAETVSDIGDYELSNRTSMKLKAAAEMLEENR